MWVSQQWLSHTGEAKNVVVQVVHVIHEADVLAAPLWYQRAGRLLERVCSSVYIGTLKKLVLVRERIQQWQLQERGTCHQE